jgi:hypothetical protein
VRGTLFLNNEGKLIKISYFPKNLDGAERYMTKEGRISDTSSPRKWIEQATAKKFTQEGTKLSEFTVLYAGIGFFWTAIASTTAPIFSTEVSGEGLPDLVDVTYWVAADALTY